MDKTNLSVHVLQRVCISVCLYARLPACLLRRGDVELVSRYYRLTNILGKFYGYFSEWRLTRRQKKKRF